VSSHKSATSPENLLPWFALKDVPGVGNLLFKRLIACFKSPEGALTASLQDLCRVEGVSQRLAAAIQSYRISDTIRTELDLAEKKGYSVVTLADPDYPQLLLEIPDPPPYLYVYGRLPGSIRNIAVVGSRNATEYGLSATRQLCRDLCRFKMTVVSGMARGIDTAAHTGAISAGGKTIAVLGSGLSQVYPAENRTLYHKIAENGAVISEFALNAGPDAHHFPVRNRIISGICLGTVIVEATKNSGSLITARLAAEQGREVFAVPGNIHSFKSTGTHSLIKQGAKLVEHSLDIMEELSGLIGRETGELPADPEAAQRESIRLSAEETMIVDALGPYPVHIDDLRRKLGMDSGRLSGILLELELKGIVRQSPGKLFSVEEK
jgi:DNA processing protein